MLTPSEAGVLREANCSTTMNGIREQETAVSDLRVFKDRDWKAGTHGHAYEGTLGCITYIVTPHCRTQLHFQQWERILRSSSWSKGCTDCIERAEMGKGTLTMPLSVICADPWTSGSSRPRLNNSLGTWMEKPTSQVNMTALLPHVTRTAQRWLWFPWH